METILSLFGRYSSHPSRPGSWQFFAEMFFVMFVLLAGAAVVIIYAVIQLRLRRIIKALPTSKISSLSSEIMFADGLSANKGLFEVCGKVVPKQTESGEPDLLKTPLTNRAAVYYDYYVRETPGSGRQSSRILVKEKVSKPFYLEDDTGRITVLLNDAAPEIKRCTKLKGTKKQPLPPALYAALDKQGVKYTPYTSSILKTPVEHYVEEFVIEPGDELYVLGPVGQEDNELIITKKKGIFYVSDQPENKILRSLMWTGVICLLIGGVIIGVLIIIFKHTAKWF